MDRYPSAQKKDSEGVIHVVKVHVNGVSIMSRLDLQKIGGLFPLRQSKLSVVMKCL